MQSFSTSKLFVRVFKEAKKDNTIVLTIYIRPFHLVKSLLIKV
jgi:hypothetical protein